MLRLNIIKYFGINGESETFYKIALTNLVCWKGAIRIPIDNHLYMMQ